MTFNLISRFVGRGTIRSSFRSVVRPAIVQKPLSSSRFSTEIIFEKSFTKEEHRAFMTQFPDLVRELTYDDDFIKDLPADIGKHLSKCIQYNVPHGKKTRGLSVLVTYKNLIPEAQRTEQGIKSAIVLGWCVELLQAYFLVADDIMDNSKTRRQAECWYKKKGIGLGAFNDSLMLESCIYKLLHNHFGDEPFYHDCLRLFQEINRITTFGQSLDLMTSNSDGDVDLDRFDMKRYSAIVKCKTSYYTMYLPVALGMKLSGVYDEELYRQARTILLEIGHYFQVQDDYLDCFGDPKITGKVGTDIQDAKCSWLIVVALQRANPTQKAILQECYGSKDPEKIEKVKSVYKEFKLKKVFASYEDETYKNIETHINQLSGGSQGKPLPGQLFKIFLHAIHKREK